MIRPLRLGALTALSLLVAAGCESDPAPPTCAAVASKAARTCVADVSAAWRACYATDDGPCDASDPAIAAALASLRADVEGTCGAGDFGALDAAAIAPRLEVACRSEASSLAWRAYGGPQGAAWAKAGDADRACLLAAHDAAVSLVDLDLGFLTDCAVAGARCEVDNVPLAREASAAAALAAVEAACVEPTLDELIAVTPDVYLARAAHQADCLAAASHADTGLLELSCGPSNAAFDPPRGEYLEVVVDGEEWGTLCGDGSPYRFHVRLAPAGQPLDRVIVGLQGGGVCVFEDDCTARLAAAPGLFTAEDDEPPVDAVMSNDPEVSPFANWTKVYLPYCSQDVFAGGGVTEELGALSLPRHGSVNMRAAVRMVRDVLWKLMDEAGGEGFRPDKLQALFGGWSAGGYGTNYNYHWFLDDLQWPRTSAFPDAGLALDNGQPLGVLGLGLVKIPLWGMKKNLPPYCFAGECALGTVLFEALSARLLTVPDQQLLVLSNPRDVTQQRDAYFGDESQEAAWINTLRTSYCDTRGLPGLHYYFTSVADESVHVVSLRPELWAGEVDGETMRDWFERAVTAPETLVDRVEEGDFVSEVPGVEPYPCEVAP